MQKRVFIVHGWSGNPDEAWLSWIRKELQGKNCVVVSPQMPNPNNPKIEEWVSFITNLVSESDEQTFFVGHSIGCQTILRYLESTSPKKVGGVILVAGWLNLQNLEDKESEEIARPWIETPIDFSKVKQATSKITVFLSDNDPWVPLSDKKFFEEKLGAEVIVEKNRGHYTEDDGVKELPILRDKLLELMR